MDIHEGALWRDVVGASTETERSCIQAELGAEAYDDLLARTVLGVEVWPDGFPTGCLTEETAIDLSVGLVAAAGELSSDARQCVRQAYVDSDAVALGFILSAEYGASVTDAASPGELVTFVVRLLLCLGDEEAVRLTTQQEALGFLPPPSDLRCVFERASVEQFATYSTERLETLLRQQQPSSEFLQVWAELADAADACGVQDFIPDAPPPLAPGRLLWKFRASSYILGSPIVANGVVYVGAGDSRLYAVNAATGNLVWRIPMDGDDAWLTEADGVIYVSGGSRLLAVDAADGNVLWQYDVGPVYYSTPAVADGVVYVGGWDRNLYAVDAATGDLRWRYETLGNIRSTPAVADGVVYFRSSDGYLYAVDAATGEHRWASPIQGRGNYQSPAVDGGVVYAGADDRLYALDAATGGLLWQAEQGVASDSRLAVSEGVVYASSGYTLDAIDAGAGNLLWQYSATYVDSSPTVAGGVVYIGAHDQHLYAIEAATGKGLWRYPTGGSISSTPAAAAGVVYFGSSDDHLYAVSTAADAPARAPTPPPTPAAGLAALTPGPPSTFFDLLRQFGTAVAISRDGQVIAVGDSMKRTDRKYGGAVYVFTRPNEEWLDLGEDAAAVLLPPDDNDWPPVPDDRDWVEVKSSFGSSLAMSADGSTVVVGAPDNLPHGYDSGAAYVFIRPAGGWGSGAPEVATLTASDGAPNQRFGQAVAVSADGQTIVIGPAGAYVFTRPSGGWTDATEAVKLAIADDPYGSFGTSVAVTGDGAAVFVGAPHAAYVFTRPGPAWSSTAPAALLTPSGGAREAYEDNFGSAVSASDDGGTVVVGAPGKDAYGEDQGAAYVFVMPETGWVDAAEAATLTASDGGRNDYFGYALAVSADGGAIVVGAPLHAHTLNRSGSAYVFSRPAEGWRNLSGTAELHSPDPQLAPQAYRGTFGGSVSISGADVVVGVPGYAAYVFNSFVAAVRTE